MTGVDMPFSGGSLGHLIEDQHNYIVRLPDIVLSSGLYQVQMVTTLCQAGISPGMFEVPLLQVI
jgi:hypothetical protein